MNILLTNDRCTRLVSRALLSMRYSCLHRIDLKNPPLIPIIEKNERLSPCLTTIPFRRTTCGTIRTKYILLADEKPHLWGGGDRVSAVTAGPGGASVVRCGAWDLTSDVEVSIPAGAYLLLDHGSNPGRKDTRFPADSPPLEKKSSCSYLEAFRLVQPCRAAAMRIYIALCDGTYHCLVTTPQPGQEAARAACFRSVRKDSYNRCLPEYASSIHLAHQTSAAESSCRSSHTRHSATYESKRSTCRRNPRIHRAPATARLYEVARMCPPTLASPRPREGPDKKVRRNQTAWASGE